MSINAYSDEQVKHLSQLFKLMAEPNRLRILCALGLECEPVSNVIEATGLSQTNVSFHLRALREAGLVRPERQGAFIYYCLSDPDFLTLLNDLHVWMENRTVLADQANLSLAKKQAG